MVMSNLKIEGNGLWVQVYELSNSEAKNIADSGTISEENYENYIDNLDGYGLGFYSDATVFVDSIEIGDIHSLIMKGINCPEYNKLHNALDAETEIDLKNAFVMLQGQKGIFVNDEVPDYGIKSPEDIPDSFIKDFMRNLCVENAGYFSLSGWNGIWFYGQDLWAKSEDYFVLCDGVQHVFDVVD